MEDPENLTEPVSNLEDENSTPPAVPDEMQAEDSIQSEVKNTTTEPEPKNPKLDLVVQSKPGTDLNSDEEIQQPHRSTWTMHSVTHLQPTMQGQHHCDTTLVTDSNIANVDPWVLGHVLTQLSL